MENNNSSYSSNKSNSNLLFGHPKKFSHSKKKRSSSSPKTHTNTLSSSIRVKNNIPSIGSTKKRPSKKTATVFPLESLTKKNNMSERIESAIGELNRLRILMRTRKNLNRTKIKNINNFINNLEENMPLVPNYPPSPQPHSRKAPPPRPPPPRPPLPKRKAPQRPPYPKKSSSRKAPQRPYPPAPNYPPPPRPPQENNNSLSESESEN